MQIEAAIWISGYYNGLRKNTMLNLNAMKPNAEMVSAACKGSPNQTIMQTVNTLFSAEKENSSTGADALLGQ
jgi:hypothetical protein